MNAQQNQKKRFLVFQKPGIQKIDGAKAPFPLDPRSPLLLLLTRGYWNYPGIPCEPLMRSKLGSKKDLFHKLQASISFSAKQAHLTLGATAPPTAQLLLIASLSEKYLLVSYSQPLEGKTNPLQQDLQTVFHQVWAESHPPGLAKHHPPVVVELLATALPVQVKQYPMSQQAREGISPHIQWLLQANILIPCQSAWNFPFLPVQKPETNYYRPEVNKWTVTVHPTVPNPYTLLSLLLPEHTVYSILDLKVAFFAISLAPKRQPIFAFEWTDPSSGDTTQLTWTQLPWRFKNSPTLFGEALQKDLIPFRASLLTVSYLGYEINKGKKALTSAPKEAILLIPPPNAKRQVCEYLVAAGYCCLWILGFTEIAEPLYSATGGHGLLVWTDTELPKGYSLKTWGPGDAQWPLCPKDWIL
ncbi:Gag-Pol polyprotein [Plecturocebus cupreus]